MPKLLTTFKEFLARESADFYGVHIDPKSLNPNHTYKSKVEYDKTKEILSKHLSTVGLGDHAKNILSVDMNDMAIAAPNRTIANHMVKKLNTVLPKATLQYSKENGVKHNAYISGVYSADGNDSWPVD